MFSVHQPWNPLRECIVGRSYSPEFFSFITNSRARSVMERIAQETEDDYQALIKLLSQFDVNVHRPVVSDDYRDYLLDGKIQPPPMTPCDYSIMVGNRFYHNWQSRLKIYNDIRADHWPVITHVNELSTLPEDIQRELKANCDKTFFLYPAYQHIIDHIEQQGNVCIESAVPGDKTSLNRAQVARIGKDLFFGTADLDTSEQRQKAVEETVALFPDYRCHVVDTRGHSDGVYCPVVPGLIVSLHGAGTYANTFPDWEVVSLPGESWSKVRPFMQLKEKNAGKWWVPGEELNNDFTDFVESWLGHWVGYVEESVFDVNMLVIDEKNVACTGHNDKVFKAFERHGITPHVVPFRHRYFWDGGLHCITSDLHREGTMQDYFPGRV